MQNGLISITGVLGSGKTTACAMLARELDYDLVQENVQGNAFLPLFYTDARRWALHSQLFYLHEKASQLGRIRTLLATRGVVQDCPLYQDFLTYAKAQRVLGNMDEHEFALYERFFHSLNNALPTPDLVVNLETSVPVIMERVKRRGRAFEQDIDPSYIELLAKLQKEWISGHPHLNILTINTDQLDLAENPQHQKEFVALVRSRLELE